MMSWQQHLKQQQQNQQHQHQLNSSRSSESASFSTPTLTPEEDAKHFDRVFEIYQDEKICVRLALKEYEAKNELSKTENIFVFFQVFQKAHNSESGDILWTRHSNTEFALSEYHKLLVSIREFDNVIDGVLYGTKTVSDASSKDEIGGRTCDPTYVTEELIVPHKAVRLG
jgi:hypothetical protein